MPDALSFFSRVMSRVLLGLAALGMCVMTGIISWQVFARYVLQASPSWTEQASLLLMIWFIFFATAVGIREGFHIRITALKEAMPDRFHPAFDIGANIVTGLIGIIVLVGGFNLTGYTWTHAIPTLGISRGYAYIPLIFSGAMIVFYSLEHILALLRGREVKPVWN